MKCLSSNIRYAVWLFLFLLQSFNESITSVSTGRVCNADYDEIVLTSYAGNFPSCILVFHHYLLMRLYMFVFFTGWVNSLTTEPQTKEISMGGQIKYAEENQNKLISLK